ncbi:MAG: citrate synthase [Planctomycetes bacterium]|nr:citrate synthase [Planctomycetota bacterium]
MDQSRKSAPTVQELSITDERTGKSYKLPIVDGTIRAIDLRQIRVDDHDFGLMAYDPAFMNTASCRSAVTYLDGDAGILRYRGYPIEQLAEKCSFLETAWLLLFGELPNKSQLDAWEKEVGLHTLIHENVKQIIDAYRYDAHPMGILIGVCAALSTLYKDASDVKNAQLRRLQMVRLIGKMPTIAAFAYRHSLGQRVTYPDNRASYTGNFLKMLFDIGGEWQPHPVLARALEVLFILHADHEQNCSTNAMRAVTSSQVDPFSGVAAATAALYGPLHGGANEAVLKMLTEIGSVAKVPDFIKSVKAGERRLMGFGHRVYKNYDPRARIIKECAYKVFDVTGKNPLLEIALELERIALQDAYFVDRKLYPNVDFYSGLIYQAMGFPTEMFPVLFAIPRTAGWLAQWEEQMRDPETKIARPRQIYCGAAKRDVTPMVGRG